MVDLVDRGEAELQQLTQKVTMSTSSAGVKASLWVTKSVAAAPLKAAAAIYRAMVLQHNKRQQSGEVSLKTFTQLTEGKREVLNIDDRAVSKELERELRRHGVTWSVEAHRDGSRTFHVQGKDAELVQHALAQASERVDEKIARRAPELQATPEQQHEQTPQQAHTSIEPHGTDELREEAPRVPETEAPEHDAQPEAVQTHERDEAVTDRGGHERQDAAPPTRSEQRPERSARDRTRAHVKEKIDGKVAERKAEIASKSKTKTKTFSRGSRDEMTPPSTKRR